MLPVSVYIEIVIVIATLLQLLQLIQNPLFLIPLLGFN